MAVTCPARDVLRLLPVLVVAFLLVVTGLLHQGTRALVGFLAELGVSGGSPPSQAVYPPARQILTGIARLHDSLARAAEAIRSWSLSLDRLVSRLDSALTRFRADR